jgi:hypothetical protein
MTFATIPTTNITVGKSVKKELFDLIKTNFDDHETRLSALSVGSGPIVLFNEDITNVSTALTLIGVLYNKAIANIQITKAQIQILGKDGISTGLLEFDLKKCSTLGGTFVSIFTTKPSINYASDAAYAFRDGVLNSGQTILIDDIIRLDITNVPTGVISKFRVMVYGVLS